ncbi:MAG TPA: T9SS type A sorting domain-containing protein, partial [Chitinophagaceae bacterium]|nr:T9SS type A sorting domain-containing protein [Chitinophagaceae bacterium]
YYRLKAMDHDGQFAYSPIVRLEKRTGSLFVKNLYPNPFTSSISIHAHADKAGELELVILNASGAVLKQFTRTVKRGDNAIVLSGLENLLAGTYTLQAIGNNEKRQFTLVKR